MIPCFTLISVDQTDNTGGVTTVTPELDVETLMKNHEVKKFVGVKNETFYKKNQVESVLRVNYVSSGSACIQMCLNQTKSNAWFYDQGEGFCHCIEILDGYLCRSHLGNRIKLGDEETLAKSGFYVQQKRIHIDETCVSV